MRPGELQVNVTFSLNETKTLSGFGRMTVKPPTLSSGSDTHFASAKEIKIIYKLVKKIFEKKMHEKYLHKHSGTVPFHCPFDRHNNDELPDITYPKSH